MNTWINLRVRDNAADILQADSQGHEIHIKLRRSAPGNSHGRKITTMIVMRSTDVRHACYRSTRLGFDMLEVMSEYRALRASVLRLWHDSCACGR